MFGAGGGTSSYREIEETDLIVLWGSNARETHPIFFHHLLRGVRNGARLFAVDPRRTSSAEWADTWLGLDVGSDIGRMARPMVGYLRPPGAYEGFDVVPEGVEWCRRRYEAHPHFRFQIADVRNGLYRPDAGEIGRASCRERVL